MKKLLLATAAFALLAPAAKAEIKLDLGGYFKGYAGYSEQDVAGVHNFDFKRKSQVFFTGETTLDNGLTVGYNGQLIQDSTVDPGVEEDGKLEQSYLFMSGNWGRVNLGRENGAAYLLQVTAPGADANLDGMDIDFSFFNQGLANIRQDYAQTGAGTNDFGSRGEDFQYSDKITYLTPKFNGFQAGVSYTPDVEANSVADYFGQSSDADGYEDLMDVGVRYDGEFSGVGIHAGAGYTHAETETGFIAADNYEEWNVGGKLSWEAFGIGAAYNNRETNLIGATTGAGVPAGALGADVDTWTVGADYTYGAYNFGVSYLDSSGDALVGGGEDEYNRWMAGVGYTFGPGMKFNGSVGLHELDAAGGVGAVAADNDAFVATIGTDIQF